MTFWRRRPSMPHQITIAVYDLLGPQRDVVNLRPGDRLQLKTDDGDIYLDVFYAYNNRLELRQKLPSLSPDRQTIEWAAKQVVGSA